MIDRFGIAVVGAGMAALPHARALRDLSDRIDVCGVYTRNPETRQAFSREYGFPVADDLGTLVADPAVDALLLLTPPDARLDPIRSFAEAGKHILSEKPLGRTAEEAAACIDICDRARVKLGVVFQHRFRAASVKLRQMVEDGALGSIELVRAEVPWWRDQSYYDAPGRGTRARDGGGVLISQAIHTLDLMLSLTGPVAEVQALAATTGLHSLECEDFATAGLRFASGAVGSVMATTAAYPGEPESIRLDGTKGSVTLRSGILRVHWRDGTEETIGEEATGTGGGADPMAFPHDWHMDLISAFADAVSNGQEPVPSGRDALRVQQLIDAMIRSSDEGRAIRMED
ncbi:Gfo/Idh/MocA family protein [Pseudoruegeria sp. HB172150]|uniref:Gfo/Idh/MocA family protein n=1 Tax=Pseudoruegeria sp. HB172150 TaxID=2721164 RepID=UPI00155297A6|nr:Gfo/Idh/MocA family oxidoreductase [Pseudoruegeria sp. HB172150]